MHAPNPRRGFSNVSEDSPFSAASEERPRDATGTEQDGRLGWVLSWNIQPRGGMQTEEPKRKPYDVLEKGEAFAYVHLTRFQKRPSRIELSRAREREYICTVVAARIH